MTGKHYVVFLLYEHLHVIVLLYVVYVALNLLYVV